jgi:UDP-N-acetylglucosamine diphosphorylase / glucose-1-phosphate thymidylyltransferase / UDP-N-acetylgalactosamine diphosphorylase / glucosamine-1-phosphate N-acetyltransferase / galactosamine-1-phosphate N-acetyltransferase
MIKINNYISSFSQAFNENLDYLPWDFIANISAYINKKTYYVNSDFKIENEIAIHKTAIVEEGAVLKGPIIISANCFVAAHAYLRGGVYIGDNTIIGPGCEIKSSAIFNHTSIAHFNFIGDSIIGSHVNFEAGSIVANHYNERADKSITITADGISQTISSTKFGALVGDHSKIGANAVLSPGTIFKPNSVVKRLELIDQANA